MPDNNLQDKMAGKVFYLEASESTEFDAAFMVDKIIKN